MLLTLTLPAGVVLDEQCMTFASGQGASSEGDVRPIDDHPGDIPSGAAGYCPATHSGIDLHARGSEGGGLMTQAQDDCSTPMQQAEAQPSLAAG